MDTVWTEEFYKETDAEKRLSLLKEHIGEEKTEAERFRENLWIARYGKRKPRKDAFIGCLMQLKYLSESGSVDIRGKKRQEAAKVVASLGLSDADRRSEEEQEILQAELKNVFLKYIEVSRGGRGFTSVIFGMGQLSDESVAKKIASQISAIAFAAPHMLRMDKEFALLQKAALAAFRQEYPNREHFLKK